MVLNIKQKYGDCPKVENKAKFSDAIRIGSQYEFYQFKEALSRDKINVRTHHIDLPELGDDIESAKACICQRLDGFPKSTIIFSDVLDTKPFGFEMMATLAKEKLEGITYVTYTGQTRCTGNYDLRREYLVSRGADPILLRNVDFIFQDVGHSEVYPAIFTIAEDKLNYQGDSERAILVVEDTPKFYTSFVRNLYEINLHRSRILLARSFEEAMSYIDNCNQRICGAIFDMQFPRNGKEDDKVAWDLYETVRFRRLGFPMIFQTSDDEMFKAAKNAQDSGKLIALSKNDDNLYTKLQGFISDFFGFGDFIFRYSSSLEPVARADSLDELKVYMKGLSEELIVANTKNRHLSNWLWMHGYRKAAGHLLSIDTNDPKEIREAFFEACALEQNKAY